MALFDVTTLLLGSAPKLEDKKMRAAITTLCMIGLTISAAAWPWNKDDLKGNDLKAWETARSEAEENCGNRSGYRYGQPNSQRPPKHELVDPIASSKFMQKISENSWWFTFNVMRTWNSNSKYPHSREDKLRLKIVDNGSKYRVEKVEWKSDLKDPKKKFVFNPGGVRFYGPPPEKLPWLE